MSDIDPLKFPHYITITLDGSLAERAEDICLALAGTKIHCARKQNCFACEKFAERQKSQTNHDDFNEHCRVTFNQRCDRATYYAKQLKNAVSLGKLQLWDHRFDQAVAIPTSFESFSPNLQLAAEKNYEANPIVSWIKSGFIAHEDLRIFCNFERFRVNFITDNDSNNEDLKIEEAKINTNAVIPIMKQTDDVETNAADQESHEQIEMQVIESEITDNSTSKNLDVMASVKTEYSDDLKSLKAKRKQIKTDAETNDFGSLPDEKFVSIETVMCLLNISETTLRRQVKDGTLKKHKIGERAIGFNVGELRAHMKNITK